MDEVIFSGAHAKLGRARHFMRELVNSFDAYRADDPFINIVHATDDIPGMPPGGRLFEHALKPMGSWPGLILGDAVHNMRSALDLLATELAVRKDASPKGVYFPFADSSHDLDDQIRRKNFRRAGDDAVMLLKVFKPYRGGNDALRAIHDLDIQDKHKALILAVRDYSTGVHPMTLEEAMSSPNPQLMYIKDLMFLFPEGTVLAGREVVPTLEHLAQVVDGVLQAFASLLAARGAK